MNRLPGLRGRFTASLFLCTISFSLVSSPASPAPITDLETTGADFAFDSSSFLSRSVDINADWRAFEAVKCSIYSARRLDIPIRAVFHLVTSEGLYYRTARRIVVNNRPLEVSLDLANGSADWYPVGHARPWSSFNLWRVLRFGIDLSAPAQISTPIFIRNAALLSYDDINAVRQSRSPQQAPPVSSLRIIRLTTTLLALDFVPADLPDAPFSPLSAPIITLTTPHGETVVRRCFLYQDYAPITEPVRGPNDLIPVGPLRWRIVWVENTPGKYLFTVEQKPGVSPIRGDFTTSSLPPQRLPAASFAGDIPLAFYKTPIPRIAASYSRESRKWMPHPVNDPGASGLPSHAWFIPLEWYSGWAEWNGPGYYDLKIAFLADLMLLNSHDRPLPILFISDAELDDHGVFRWGASPLNCRNGGPLEGPKSLFLNATALQQVSARAAYAVRRWGDFPSVNGLVTTVTSLHDLSPSWHNRLAETLSSFGVANDTPLYSANRMALPPKSQLLLASFERPGEPLAPVQAPPSGENAPPSASSSGHRSLALTHRAPASAALEARLTGGLSLGDHTLLAVDVKLPSDAPGAARLQFILRDGDYGWYEYLSPDLLAPGDWNSVHAPLDDLSAWTRHGACADYNPYTRQDIKEVLVRVFPNADFQGTLLLDNLRCLTLADETPPPLKILDIKTSPNAPLAWSKFEISFDLPRAFPNPFDPAVVDVSGEFTLPDGRRLSIPGFFHQDYVRSQGSAGQEVVSPVGRPYWKVRFAPPIPGDYSAVVTVTCDKGRETVSSDPIRFSVAQNPGAKGPVKALGANAFGFADGSPFYPVGLNLRSPSDSRDAGRDPEILREIGLAATRGTFQYDDYFAAFQKAGLNWARVWMCSWWLGLEWYRKWPGFRGAGYYNLANAWRLDHVLDEAARRGVYIQLYTMNHGQVSTHIDHEWEYHPYNYYDPEAYTAESRVTDHELVLRPDAENFRRPLGFLKSAADFFSNETARRLTRNKLRYIVARWAYSPNIFAWVLSSEVEFTGEYWRIGYDKGERSPATAQWHREMASYLKQIDPYSHLVSTHFSHPHRGQDVWAIPELDFVQSNAYSTFWWFGGQGMDRETALRRGKPEPSVGAPRAIQKYYDDFLRRWNRPAIVGEWGGHWMGNPRPFLDAELFTGTWAMVVSPLAGATGFWWWPYVHFRDRYHLISPAIAFARERVRPADGIVPIHGRISNTPNFSVLAYGRRDWGADCFIYHSQLPYDIASPAQHPGGGKVLLQGLQPGFYSIDFWDAFKGSVFSQAEVSALAGSVEFALPAFSGAVAVAVRRIGAPGEPTPSRTQTRTETAPAMEPVR